MFDWMKFVARAGSLPLMTAGASGGAAHQVGLPPLDALAGALQQAGAATLVEVRVAMTLLYPTSLQAQALAPVLSGHLVADVLPRTGVVQSLDGCLLHCQDGRIRDAQGNWHTLGPELRWGGLRVRCIEHPLGRAARSLRETLAAAPDLRGFAHALQSTGLERLLDCAGPFTVFAPSGDAHSLDAEGVRRHILPGRWTRASLGADQSLRTLGAPMRVTGAGPASQPLLPHSDLACRNGVLHRIARPLPA